MKAVILGLKHKKTGKYLVFNPDIRSNEHTKVKIGDTVSIPILSPFPFEHFSSITFDYQPELEALYDKCYLLVETDLSKREYYNMNSNGIMYHRFNDRTITFISELTNPIQYALDVYLDFQRRFGKQSKLDIHNLHTWVIHEDTETEHQVIERILELSYVNRGKYIFDLSVSNNIIKQLTNLHKITNGGHMTFGLYGRIKYDKDIFFKEDIDVNVLLWAQKLGLSGALSHPNLSKSYNTLSNDDKKIIFESLYELEDLAEYNLNEAEVFKDYFELSLKANLVGSLANFLNVSPNEVSLKEIYSDPNEDKYLEQDSWYHYDFDSYMEFEDYDDYYSEIYDVRETHLKMHLAFWIERPKIIHEALSAFLTDEQLTKLTKSHQ